MRGESLKEDNHRRRNQDCLIYFLKENLAKYAVTKPVEKKIRILLQTWLLFFSNGELQTTAKKKKHKYRPCSRKD